jgi:hypothetical protein
VPLHPRHETANGLAGFDRLVCGIDPVSRHVDDLEHPGPVRGRGISSFFSLGTWVIAVAGAMVLLVIYSALMGGRRGSRPAPS